MKDITLLLLITASPILHAVEWLYGKEVLFQDHHDLGRIVLQGQPPIVLDDRVYYRDLYDKTAPAISDLSYSDVSKWKTGRAVTIAYASETGAVLLDPDTGKYPGHRYHQRQGRHDLRYYSGPPASSTYWRLR